jgi:hypothetical protein
MFHVLFTVGCRGALAAAAEQYTPLYMSGHNRPRERDCKVGVVVTGVEYHVSKIDNLVSFRRQLLSKLLLHLKTAVIRGDTYSHTLPLSPEIYV